MRGQEESFVLYFNVQMNEELRKLHQAIYDILPSNKYNPQTFQFHITIAIDKDYEKIKRIKNSLEDHFSIFELEIDSLGLFEIYPANLVKKINSND